MATATTGRLPLRLLSQLKTANPLIPAAQYIRAQHAATPSRPLFLCRHASDVAAPNPEPSSSMPPLPGLETADFMANRPLEPLMGVDKQGELDFRLPRSVQAVYLRPLRREAKHGIPSCDLQLRSYSVRNLEFFADFALRAAYYLGLPASGPVPLPRITERWTVPRSSFIYKKSQENFDRRTVRRLIQIKDGHPETVEIWLAFLKKHAYYGIGMKANVYEFCKLGVGKNMDIEMQQIKSTVDKTFDQVGVKHSKNGKILSTEEIMELVNRENFRSATHGNAPFTNPPAPF